MGYQVKWVNDNMGVTRKALRVYEEMGLMPKNKHNQYRDYDEDDLDRIWTICVLKEMGYALKEIRDMFNDSKYDFQNSIAEKIRQLEQEIEKKEQHLGYAKTIKLTGRFPIRPLKMGTVKIEDFKEKTVQEWNMFNETKVRQQNTSADVLFEKPQEQWGEENLKDLWTVFEKFDFSNDNWELIQGEHALIKALTKRKALGKEHPEVQLIVKIIFENQQELVPEFGTMTPQQFARFYAPSYVVGDVARMKENTYGKEGCKFIAHAVAVFGGYSDYEELETQ